MQPAQLDQPSRGRRERQAASILVYVWYRIRYLLGTVLWYMVCGTCAQLQVTDVSGDRLQPLVAALEAHTAKVVRGAWCVVRGA